LLRRYGYVDLLPLRHIGADKFGNPGDIVELRADIIVQVMSKKTLTPLPDSMQERINWWLDEGGDEYV
jgi:N-lysine methyltransferase SETD6